jgi:hypothetical protein
MDNPWLHTYQVAFSKGRLEGVLSFPFPQPATKIAKLLVHLIQIKLLGIELASNPFQGVLMLIVLGVLDCVEEVTVIRNRLSGVLDGPGSVHHGEHQLS